MASQSTTEIRRLDALRAYDILDTIPEQAFDELTAMASAICGTPIALVSLVDEDRQWFKSKVGIEVNEGPRSEAFCAHVIEQSDLFVIPDATKDARFAENPLVTGGPKIRFYAGSPLIAPGGEKLGTLCVIDQKPRKLTAAQSSALAALSRQVMSQIELRHKLKENERIIAESAAIEAELREKTLFQNAILNSADYAIISTTPEGVILTFNAAAERMLGYRAEELVGKSTPAVFHDPAEVVAHAETLTRELRVPVEPGFSAFIARAQIGRPDENEWTYIRKDGSRFPVLLSITGLWNERGTLTGFLGIGNDITERKRAQVELAKARDAALETARLKSEFLANMSHEIRTPMNAIIGTTELLNDTPLSEDQQELSKTIQSCADSLLTIINEILDFSKIEAGKLVFESIEFNLFDCVESAVEVVAEKARRKGIELISHIGPMTPYRLRGDPNRLKQVLLNLIDNAIKFTSEGSVVVNVKLEKASARFGVLRFSITDSGIGISAESQSRLFEPFSQADGSTTRKYGGTGLGLVICKRLVELMKGTIEIDSAPGLGSTFWFTAEFELLPGANPPKAARPIRDGARVLVVDDSEMHCHIVCRKLNVLNLRSTAVESAEEALNALDIALSAKDPYALALIDSFMPDQDGIALAKEIRADRDYAATELVLMKPRGGPNDAELKALGFAGCLNKPLKQSHLIQCLTRVLDGRTADFGAQLIPVARTAELLRPTSRVLVVDDNELNRKMMLRMLDKLGYESRAADGGVEAIRLCSSEPFDIVLMDGQMPGMDGYQTTAELRKGESLTRPLKIIALTAHATDEARERCLKAGMDDFVSKPIRMQPLKIILEKWSGGGAVAGGGTRIATVVEAPPIDATMLQSAVGDDPSELAEFIGIYLKQTDLQMQMLKQAISVGSAIQVEQAAHLCAGASGMCGANALMASFRALETQARDRRLQGALDIYATIQFQYERVKTFLTSMLPKSA